MALWTPEKMQTAPDLWLDAADGSYLYDATSGGSLVAPNGAVARWEDRSGNSRHGTQSTIGFRPTYKTSILNGLGCVRWDGSNDMLNLVPFNQSWPCHVFAVVDTTLMAGGGWRVFLNRTAVSPPFPPACYFGHGEGSGDDKPTIYWGGGSVVVFPTALKQTMLFEWRLSIGSAGLRKNESNSETSASHTQTATSQWIAIALDWIQQPRFDCFEVLVVQQTLTTAQRQQIGGYLMWKWGLQASLPADHPYYAAAPTTGSSRRRRDVLRGGVL